MQLRGKRGQIAIFVIVALIIIGGVVTFFVLRGNLSVGSIPAEFRPVYDKYQSCITEETRAAVDLAGSQGGYIYPPVYQSGSDYAPSSSQLSFLGFPVPYWSYVSANGVMKEQVPDKKLIESQIAQYVSERLSNCDFDSFGAQGITVQLGDPKVEATFSDSLVSVKVVSPLKVVKEDVSALKSDFSVDVSSKFGKFYGMALGIYNKEKNEAFLENYSVDVLRNYAPVDGVEIGCAPKIWKTREVVDGLKSGLQANVAALRFQGNYFQKNEKNKYFIINYGVDESVNMMYLKDWPTKVDISGADNELMVAQPLGNQEGLGIMGFCYSPYHFVYDVYFPVMIQIFDSQEIFQFPVISVIDKNMPRNGIPSEVNLTEPDFDLCQFKDNQASVKTYDVNLNPIDANIKFSCLGQECDLGKTSNGELSTGVPACTNGYLIAKADGYAEKKQLFSSNQETGSDIILDKEYTSDIQLTVNGKDYSGNAVVTFSGPSLSTSVSLPGDSQTTLIEGAYNISVYVYANTSITIPGETKTQCQDIVSPGIAGFFGARQQQCYEINVPDTKIDSAIIGGGKSEAYLLPGDLEDGKLKLAVQSLPVPNSLTELQDNYRKFDGMGVEVLG